jgi:hypothetical protein
MTRRRLGVPELLQLASSPSVEAAVSALAQTTYGRQVRPGQTLAEAQRAVVDAFAWNARVLAGWSPREGVTILRVLVAPLEVANVQDHLQRLAGGAAPAAFRLGGLATAWPRLQATSDGREITSVLTASAWGDPGGESPRDIGLSMRASLADRVIAAVPPAGAWAAGATALLVAREVVLEDRRLPHRIQLTASRVIGPAAASATTLPALLAGLPSSAQWALAGVDDPRDLWRAEARWWARVEKDSAALARRATAGPKVLVGAVGLMAVDAWRVRAALEVAARGGGPVEAFHAVA